MPAEFPTSVTGPLGRLRVIAQSATSFASDVTALLTALVGANNPFGTAATRDTGTAEGNVPVLGAGGEIARGLIPAATADERGGVVLARGITDARAGVVPTAAQVAAFVAAAGSGLDAANLTVTQLRSGVLFNAPATGLIVVGAAGGGGHRPPADSAAYLTDGQGANAADSFLYFGPQAGSDAATTRLQVRGGFGGARRGGQGAPDGITFPAVPAGAGRPDFAMVFDGKGAQGGVGGLYVESAGSIGFAGLPGEDGALLIAKVSSAAYRVVLGAPGAGAAALTGLASGRRSEPGGRGLNGFAFYVRLV